MKKVFGILFLLTLCVACEKKESNKNLHITGNVNGLKEGTLYIQRIVDTSLVVIDSIKIDGDSHFQSDFDIKSPEMLYLALNRGTTNSMDNTILFFAEPGNIHIETDLDYFYAKAKITGSKNQELYEMYRKINAQFNEQELNLTEAQFKAFKSKNQSSLDSIDKVQSIMLKRKYLFAVNFAVNNRNYEVSPYIALSEISNVNLKFLDTIQKAMTPKVAKSLYGKKLTAFFNERKKAE